MLQHGKDIASSKAWDILLRVKRTGGLCVNELSAQLKMSYMGIKQHCDELKKHGYLETWRRAKTTGRPEKLYRATDKLDELLPQWSNELTLGLLSVVSELNGGTAAERLLHHFFLHKTERLLLKIKGATVRARAAELVKLRTADGGLCLLESDAEQGLRLVEQHNPLKEVARLYPAVTGMETNMIARLLKANVTRSTVEDAVVFHITEPAPAAHDEFRLEAH